MPPNPESARHVSEDTLTYLEIFKECGSWIRHYQTLLAATLTFTATLLIGTTTLVFRGEVSLFKRLIWYFICACLIGSVTIASKYLTESINRYRTKAWFALAAIKFEYYAFAEKRDEDTRFSAVKPLAKPNMVLTAATFMLAACLAMLCIIAYAEIIR